MKIYFSVFFIVISFLTGWFSNGWRKDQQLSELEKNHAEAITREHVKALKKAQSQIEQYERITNEAINQKEKALADARLANDISSKLHKRIDTITRNACNAAINRSDTTASTRNLYSDMFARIDEVAGELAEYADRARIAGLACEKQYKAR